MKKVYLKIIIPSAVSILLFILTIFLIIIPRFQENIMEGKREMIKELTNSAWSILSKYENDERNGILTHEMAQKTAISRIQYLRYGDENKDYFWITDMHPRMVMHPYRTDLNGKDLSNFRDPHGTLLFVECVKTVEKSGHGYVNYMWQWKEDSLHIVPKLSYVKAFKEWDWIIGTGIYIEDVKKEIKALTRKLIWISTGISILIAGLLLFISQQSLTIEQKRAKAENDLNESKEKYRTLVEAATEGLIMLADGRITFLNGVVCKMTGFENTELLNRPISAIVSENNDQDLIETFAQDKIREGQYDIHLKKKNGGFIEVLITSSSAVFSGREVNIIILKNITTDRNSNLSVLDYQKLLNTLNIGFFRTSIDSRGKFIFANETAIKILGSDNFRELSETSFIKIPVNPDDRNELIEILLKDGYIRNKVLKIHRKNHEPAYVSVTLVLYDNKESKEMICDGVIEDVTLIENEKMITGNLISGLKSNMFLMEQPIGNFLSQVYTLDADSTINEGVKSLSVLKTGHLLITKNGKDPIGIITSDDLQKRVLALNLRLDNPAYLIMSSPIVSINEGSSVRNALTLCEEKRINHLIVKNDANDIKGIVKIQDVYKSLKNSLSFLITDVKKAATIDELKNCHKSLQQLIIPLIASEITIKYITDITSAFSDAVISRIIELTTVEIGPPPVDFSFICLGSEGRQEETLYTDQDNAIIYDDVQNENKESVNEYFKQLGKTVCDALNRIGYSYCKGNVMAKNPIWCQPLSVWEKYFANWITTPEAQNLLDATIFFDFRNIYGNEEFTISLQKTIGDLIKKQSVFLYHLAHNTFNTKTQQITSGTIISDKNPELIDLKNAVSLLTMFTRTYSLQNNIFSTNTIDRLNALKAKRILNENTVQEIIFAYNFLMSLRFKNQMRLLGSQLPLSNSISTKELIEIELVILKKTLASLTVWQNKIGLDFRITS
jgi:PAS domain S-box-containing protein